jgi:hypothetical protein
MKAGLLILTGKVDLIVFLMKKNSKPAITNNFARK